MKTWGSKLSKTDNPLAAHAGKPFYSGGGSEDRYLGRVIIELWEVKGPTGPVVTASYGADPVDVSARELAEAAGVAFAKLLEQTRGST
jgi:hypothetical protein